AMMFGQPLPLPPAGSTLDATAAGNRAAFLLLEQLGFPVRASRRATEGKVRWLLFPHENVKDIAILNEWVNSGGLLLLADDRGDLAQQLQVPLDVNKEAGTGSVALQFQPRPLMVEGGDVCVTPRNRPDRTWPAEGPPLAGIFRRGRGELWVL